jgi:uncharacterized protein (DUF302 family)
VCVRSELVRRETTDRLVAILARRSLPIATRVDHGAAARSTGLEMLPAELFIFGNPLAGTPLMKATPSMAIVLPLKILVTEDSAQVCWLTYNDPIWIGRRHGVALSQYPALLAMHDMLDSITDEAAGRNDPGRQGMFR